MKIHNLYSDFLKSLTYLFDNVIFGSNTISKYVFNIGNRSFQLEYQTQFKLPTAIVTLSESHPLNLHPTNVQRIPIGNINRIPVIFNRSKDLLIELQEEIFNLVINVDINCESQFQAKDVEYQITSILPINKWMAAYSYSSFIELTDNLLDPDILDTTNDDLVNLFSIYDYNKGQPSYCFSVNYRPYFRLTSIASNIASSSQRTFPVNLQLDVLTQFPQYLTIPIEERPIKTFSRKLQRNNIIYTIYHPDKILLHDKFLDSFYLNTNNEVFSSSLSAKFDWIENYTDIDFNSQLLIERNFKTNTTICKTTGSLSGTIDIINDDRENSKLTGIFNGLINNKIINDNISLKYIPISITYNSQANKALSYSQYFLDVVPDVNSNKVDINFKDSYLKSVVYLDTTTNIVSRFDLPVPINFSDNGQILTTILIDTSLSIKVDKVLYYDLANNSNIEVLAFIFDLSLISKPKYGASYFERIILDFNTESFPITEMSIQNFADNLENSKIDTKMVFASLIQTYDPENFTMSVIIPNNTLPAFTSWKFKSSKINFGSDSPEVLDKVKIIEQTSFSLVFQFDKEFFYKYIQTVTSENPIFLYLYQ